jgi:hypothetical protein
MSACKTVTKAVVPFGYNRLVMDVDDALTFLGILAKSEFYESNGYREERTHHVWSDADRLDLTLTLLSPETYHGAKLAGKRE